jgi:hypothetical protein
MTSVVRLRSISLAGSVTFVVYGVLIGSIPIVITNGAIAAINMWFLWSELTVRRDLGARVVAPDNPFLADFITFHLQDIHHFQPEFAMPAGDDAFALVLIREGLPAGAMIGRRRGHELLVDLDYVMRAYRDSHLGRWLVGKGGAPVLRNAGITRLVTIPGTDSHRSYLERIGFRREATPEGERYARTVG